MPSPAIEVKHLYTEIEGQKIHQDLNFTVEQGEIVAIVGGSGSGKSTLLNCLLMLLQPVSGSIKILGEDVAKLSNQARDQLQMQCGILFQGGALFSELTVLENVLFPMRQHSDLNKNVLTELAFLKVAMAGLSPEDAYKYPAELSGGMIKRAAMARSLALDPAILFLDEPSAGLDPVNANSLDRLILDMRASLKLTIVIVTHDLDTLAAVPDRIAFLAQGKVVICDKLQNLINSDIPEVKTYFQNPRAKRTFVE